MSSCEGSAGQESLEREQNRKIGEHAFQLLQYLQNRRTEGHTEEQFLGKTA